MRVVTHAFGSRDLVAGHPALDFVNTVTARDTAMPLDWLDGYRRLLDWAVLAGVIDAAAFSRLCGLADEYPRRAAAALGRAKRLREALHDLFAALIEHHPVPADALREVDAAWKKALTRSALLPAAGRVVPGLEVARSGLDHLADVLAISAVELLGDFPAGRARLCRGTQCGWLFIDSSKGGRRVWCDMSTCGNVAKSRRHYERHRRR